MLELIDVKKVYKTKAGDTVALNGVNLKFADKGLVFITGKSGCGKTTLLNMIGGLDNLDSGDIVVEGKKFSQFTLNDYDNYRNTLVGFVFQEYNLLSEFSIKKNINIANELQGKKPQSEEVSYLLNTVEIGGYENRKPAQLSGGQKQRVAIARALIKNPKIVLADEPTGALDSATGIQVMDILKQLSKDKLIIVVSHEMEFAEKYADRIIKMVDGQVVEDITLSDIEVKESVYDLGQELVIKTGVKLNKEEGEKVLSAIENNKKISLTDKISIRKRKKTGKIDYKKPDNPISFIKSKMKFKSIFALGIKSLVSKPVRLVFTILLSVIAFSLFGLFDAVASYNTQRAVAILLDGNEYNAVSVSATVDDSQYKEADFKLSQNYINLLNAQTGYAFRGVYDITDAENTGGNRSNMNKSYKIQGLDTGVSYGDYTSEHYYLKDVNGIIEFKESEIQNGVILGGSYNYRILPFENSHYPTLDPLSNIQEIGISSYTAQSIAYWLGYYNQTTFGEKPFIKEDLGTLIGAKVYLSGSSKVYQISAIIDCGQIPEKYEKLKEKDASQYVNLKEDFETFLNSSCNLMLFLPDGYTDSMREEYNRIVSYYGDYVKSTYKIEVKNVNEQKNEQIEANYRLFYNVNDITANNAILFDDVDNLDNSAPVLKDDEVLINAYDIEKYFKVEASASQQANLYNLFKESRDKIFTETSLQNKKQAVKDFIQILKEIYNNKSDQQIKDQILNKKIDILRCSAVAQSTKVYSTNTYKVVGIYFGVNTDMHRSPTSKYNPMVMNENGLKNLGINLNQGSYSRAISSLYGVNGNADRLSKLLTNEEGFKLNWYNNKIIETLEYNAEFISNFIELFLYAAIILMVFSVFMLMNYITASISSKRQTVGILRALGTNGASVFTMFLIESIIIALINGVLACVVAYVASIFVNTFIIESMSLTVSFALFGSRQIILIMVANLITGFVSSIMPIIKIVKEKPVALIRKG